ncbi:MAG: trehalose-6-phosphate synthase [Calditrichia bacterium]
MESAFSSQNRLIIVSNRLPIVLSKAQDDEWQVEPGSGGLVTAMAPVLKNRGGVWIGWPGNMEDDGLDTEDLLAKQTQKFGYHLKPVSLTAEEIQKYYKGFANEIIWPLFHDLIDHCNFDPIYWEAYREVNRKFAEVTIKDNRSEDFVWVHDYHLMCVGEELRKMGIKSQVAFFLHIPFPPPDVFLRLPWRFQILNALLEYDLLGFQTLRDRRNFMQCVRIMFKEVRRFGGGQVFRLRIGKREIRVGAFPISIDYHEFSRTAATKEVADKAWYIHEDIPKGKIILGVDRLDYTKGIPQRMKAYQNALRRFPELRENVTFVQVVVPSRRDIPEYEHLKEQIERLVGEINGEFTRSGWVPFHYIFRSLDRQELVAYYRTSEIALITPLKDGMNLISKEYCASNQDGNGVLILSEFAGTVAQFQKYALLVNPHDIEGVANAIHQAYHMPEDERKSRMQRLRLNVRRYNIFWWVDSFLDAAIAKNLDNFPLLEDYVPTQQTAES